MWPVATNEYGSYIIDPKAKIAFVCTKYLEKLTELDEVMTENVFNVMLSGDGFNITKTHMNALNFTFSLINDGDLSHKGFYVLGYD